MKIGKNLHIEYRKKAYRKPVMEVVELDSIIRLNPISDEMGPPFVAGSTSQEDLTTTDQPNYDETQQYPKDNPFGGGTPTYER